MAKRKRVSRKQGRKGTKKRTTNRRRSVPRKKVRFNKALSILKSMKKSDRCKAIASSNNKFIRDFCTAVKKLRSKKVSPKLRKRLAPYKGQLRKLANPKVSIGSKRKVLTQRGGVILPLLAPLLAPLIGPVVRSVAKAVTG